MWCWWAIGVTLLVLSTVGLTIQLMRHPHGDEEVEDDE